MFPFLASKPMNTIMVMIDCCQQILTPQGTIPFKEFLLHRINILAP